MPRGVHYPAKNATLANSRVIVYRVLFNQGMAKTGVCHLSGICECDFTEVMTIGSSSIYRDTRWTNYSRRREDGSLILVLLGFIKLIDSRDDGSLLGVSTNTQ